MHKNFLSLAVLLLTFSGLTSCIDRELCYYHDHPHAGYVKPVFNWTEDEWLVSEMPAKMGFMFMGVDGSIASHDTIGVYKMLTGDYSFITYSIDSKVKFKGEDISSLEAYTDVLGGFTTEPGVIFQQTSSCSVFPDDTTLVTVSPKSLVKGINLTVNVEGLDDPSHVTSINCFLGGCATGVNLSTGIKKMIPATIPFSMRREVAGKATFLARTTTFGPVVDDNGQRLTIDLNLYSGGTISFPVELSEYWLKAEAEGVKVIDCSITVKIKKLGISTDDTEGDVNIDDWGPGVWDTLL